MFAFPREVVVFFSLTLLSFPLMGSQLFARDMNLDWPIRAQSGTWSSKVSNSRGRQTRFTPVGLPYGRI